MGFMGVEFDFDEKLISVSGKWMALAVIVALYILPGLPSLKDIIAKAKERTEEQNK
jgi:hypothetical protein